MIEFFISAVALSSAATGFAYLRSRNVISRIKYLPNTTANKVLEQRELAQYIVQEGVQLTESIKIGKIPNQIELLRILENSMALVYTANFQFISSESIKAAYNLTKLTVETAPVIDHQLATIVTRFADYAVRAVMRMNGVKESMRGSLTTLAEFSSLKTQTNQYASTHSNIEVWKKNALGRNNAP